MNRALLLAAGITGLVIGAVWWFAANIYGVSAIGAYLLILAGIGALVARFLQSKERAGRRKR